MTRYIVILIIGLATQNMVFAQSVLKETFNHSKDQVLDIDIEHTDISFETWDKDVIEIEAFIEGENLTEEDRKAIFEHWDLEVVGNSKKISVKADKFATLYGSGFEFPKEHQIRIKELANRQDFKDLKSFKIDLPELDLKEFKNLPKWPFGDHDVFITTKNKKTVIHTSKKAEVFDQLAYNKNKKDYVKQLNKKFNAKASVKEVDQWLEDVEQWHENLEKMVGDYEAGFTMKIEETFGEDFEKRMEAWGERFGKEIEFHVKRHSKDVEKWAEELSEDITNSMDIEVIVDEAMEARAEAERSRASAMEKAERLSRQRPKAPKVVIKRLPSKSSHPKHTKRINIKLPKGVKSNLNVKYGQVIYADVNNINANLKYASFKANTISGKETLMQVSYSPLQVNHWNEGTLVINDTKDCRINNVDRINLELISSELSINKIDTYGALTSAFGKLYVNGVGKDFEVLKVSLDNADTKINIPQTAFQFSYDGKYSKLDAQPTLHVKESQSGNRTIKRGYYLNNNHAKSINIVSDYSTVILN